MRGKWVLFGIMMAALGACSQSGTASGGAVVTSLPTLNSMTPGETQYYDDGKCPDGQIAKFSRRMTQGRMTRICVDRPV